MFSRREGSSTLIATLIVIAMMIQLSLSFVAYSVNETTDMNSDPPTNSELTEAQEIALSAVRSTGTDLGLESDWLATGGGSGGYDVVNDVATDSSGNAIVAGSVSYNVTLGNIQVSAPSGSSGFVAKLNPFGYWTWAVALDGGSSNIVAIDIDSNDMVYMVGSTSDEVSAGAYTLGAPDETGIFVGKLNPQGAWVWAKSVLTGNSWSTEAKDISVDDNGYPAIVGHYYSSITFGTTTLSSNGGTDIFVAKLNGGGTNWNWAKSFGGVNYDYGNAIDTWEIGANYSGVCSSHQNNFVITGQFTDVIDFDSYSFNLERYNSSAYVTWVCGNDGDVFDAWSEGVPSSSSTTVASWYLASHFNTWSLGTAWSVPTSPSSVDSCTGYANGNSWSYLFTYDCNYPNGLTTTSYATSPTVSGTGYSTSDSYTLEFDRLLGIESSTWDHVNIQVYKNGGWYTIWSNPSTTIDESNLVNQTWTKVQYDVSNYFPGNSAFKVRFGIGTTDSSVSFTGWNIDNVKITRGSNSIPSRSIGWDLASYNMWATDEVTCVALAGTGSGVLRMDTSWANDLDTGGYDSDVFVSPICSYGWTNYNAWGETVLSEASNVAKVSIDSNYKVTVSGSFSGSVDFDGTYLTSSSGSSDIFVATIDDFAQSSSSTFDWDSAKRGGGDGYDRATAHAVTTNGATILGGYFSGESSYGSNQLSSYSNYDGLITQLSFSGSWSWAEQIGGAGGYDSARGVAALSDGSTAVVGGFEGTADFESTAITSNGGLDGFVAIYEANGTLRHITSFGNNLDEGGVNIVEGASGSLYIMGEMECYSNIVNILGKAVSCPNQNTSGGQVWFVAKLNAQLQASWVTPFGIDDYGSGELRLVSEYGDGSVLACGSYSYGALRVGNFVDTLDHYANQDLFCARLSSSNGNPMWLATADMDGRYENIYAYDIEIDDQDQAYLTGQFSGTVAFGSASTLASAGEEGTSDIFVASIGSSGAWSWAIAGGGTEYDRGTDIFLDGSGNLNVMGGFTGSAALGNTMLTGNDAYTTYPFIAGVTNTGSWTSASKIDADNDAWTITSTAITDDLQMVWFIHFETLTLGSNVLDAAPQGLSFSVGMFNKNSGEWEAAETVITPEYNIDIYYQGFDAHGDGRVVVAGAYSGENSPIPGQSAITDGSTNAFLASWSFDADGDGIQNAADACPYGATGWTSSASTDHDSDGCKDDDIEDPDDDNDGRLDPLDEVVPLWGEDSCPKGELGWTSDQATNDHDSDGCLDDSDEDTDDDNDGMTDPLDPAMPLQGEDNCYRGELNWTSDASTDHDSDGCMDDSSEDLDDDNDGIPDPADQQAPVAGEDFCPRGDLGWTSDNSTDMDGDGCRDAGEDTDDDADGYSDDADSCPNGLVGWTPTAENDHDSDGCEDATEDPDDDNDTVLDPADDCPTGALGWISDSVTDHDSDGCKDDDSEDLDDDNDVKGDPTDSAAPVLGEDFCPRGDLGWVSSGETDLDGDGCQDSGEDVDDDGDGRIDSEDGCPSGVTHWDSLDSSLDHDSDGCRDDSSEDADDDDDTVPDPAGTDTLVGEDSCPRGEINWISSRATDHDGDGCKDDSSEDVDDDNDGILDGDDNCPLSQIDDNGSPWISTAEHDYDGDGCRDETEDSDDDGDGVLDAVDGCVQGELNWISIGTTDLDGDGCNDALEDDDDDGDGTPDKSQLMLTGDGATYTWTIIGAVVGLLVLLMLIGAMIMRKGGGDDDEMRQQIADEIREDLEFSQITSGSMGVADSTRPPLQREYDRNVQESSAGDNNEICSRCGNAATWYEQDRWSWCQTCNDWVPEEPHEAQPQLSLVETPAEVVHICTLCQGRMKPGATIVKCGGCGKPYHVHCAGRTDSCNLCGTTLS